MELNRNMQTHLLHTMFLIREFELKVSELKNKNVIWGSVHCCNGQEAVSAGVCSALNKSDYLISNHRPHGHAIAKGVSVDRMMSEMFGKVTGTNGGKGGSMHINDPEVGMINSTGIVASGLPIACGAAYSAKRLNNGRISCVFFGDGSANEGIVHECLNLAAIWNLPVLFVLENNELAITVNTNHTSACQNYVKLVNVYGIEGVCGDGQNVEEVFQKSQSAVEYIRNNNRPYFLQFNTVRFCEHAEGAYYTRMISTNYRDYKRLQLNIAKRDPIVLYSKYLVENGVLDEIEIMGIRNDVICRIQHSIEFAKEVSLPDVSAAFEGIYTEGR